MAKKSKAKKRRQSAKKASAAKSAVASKATAKLVKTAPEEILSEEEAMTTDEVETDNLEYLMNEAAPREPLNQRWIIYALIGVVALLAVVLLVMYQKTSDLRQNAGNTGQDTLLQVHQSDQNSLQPTGSAGGSSSPQGSANPQDSTGANQLQPQTSPSPAQLDGMQ